MKKLDRLLLISFIPPFLVTFGIATFVLLMQILWVYIDDIAGKGLSMLMIFELLSYKAVGLSTYGATLGYPDLRGDGYGWISGALRVVQLQVGRYLADASHATHYSLRGCRRGLILPL
jgi:hypothetical protein